MRDLSVDQWVNIGASTLAAVACAAFIIIYHAKAPWWRSDIGRNLIAFAAAVGLLCAYTVLVSLFPDGCFAIVMRAVRITAVLAISALMVQRTRLLLKAQREHHDTGR
ncbi:putative phage holin [Streptomyces sp. NPDC002920]